MPETEREYRNAIQKLKSANARQNKEVARLKKELSDKDDTISDLRRQVRLQVVPLVPSDFHGLMETVEQLAGVQLPDEAHSVIGAYVRSKMARRVLEENRLGGSAPRFKLLLFRDREKNLTLDGALMVVPAAYDLEEVTATAIEAGIALPMLVFACDLSADVEPANVVMALNTAYVKESDEEQEQGAGTRAL